MPDLRATHVVRLWKQPCINTDFELLPTFETIMMRAYPIEGYIPSNGKVWVGLDTIVEHFTGKKGQNMKFLSTQCWVAWLRK